MMSPKCCGCNFLAQAVRVHSWEAAQKALLAVQQSFYLKPVERFEPWDMERFGLEGTLKLIVSAIIQGFGVQEGECFADFGHIKVAVTC